MRRQPRTLVTVLLAIVAAAACTTTTQATVPHGPADTLVEIAFIDGMGGQFRIERVTLQLDGMLLADLGAPLPPLKPFEAGRQLLAAGDHELFAVVRLRGHGEGVFSYLKGYRFETKRLGRLHVDRGTPLRFVCVAYEQGAPTTPLEERPAIRFESRATAP